MHAETIAAVAESVEENLGFSIPRHSLELVIPQKSLHHILHKDLNLKAYKVQLTQELKPADHQQRRVFADWVSLEEVTTEILGAFGIDLRERTDFFVT